MRLEQLEHIIRAAAVIADGDELIIIGSQAILGAYPTAPSELLVSAEADVYPKNFPERADLIALRTPATRGATGWCLHPHDLALAKLAAGREKDLRFVATMAKHSMLDLPAVEALIPGMTLPRELAELVRSRLHAAATSGARAGETSR